MTLKQKLNAEFLKHKNMLLCLTVFWKVELQKKPKDADNKKHSNNSGGKEKVLNATLALMKLAGSLWLKGAITSEACLCWPTVLILQRPTLLKRLNRFCIKS